MSAPLFATGFKPGPPTVVGVVATRLNQIGTAKDIATMVGKGRFELPTSRSRTVHSNLAELLPEKRG